MVRLHKWTVILSIMAESESPTLSASWLSRQARMQLIGLYGVCEQLESAGLVTRKKNGRVYLTLTGKGRRVGELLSQVFKEIKELEE